MGFTTHTSLLTGAIAFMSKVTREDSQFTLDAYRHLTQTFTVLGSS